MRIFYYKRSWLILLLPFSFLLTVIAGAFPSATEYIYSQRIYRILSGLFGRIISFFPFSVTTFVIVGSLLSAIVFCVRQFSRKRHRAIYIHRKKTSRTFRRFGATIFAVTGCLYFSFVLFCAPNYHRLTFASQNGLDVHDSSVEELAELCFSLVEDANKLREPLPEDQNGVMQLDKSSYQLSKQAQQVYGNAAEVYPVLSGYVARPKHSFFSRAMSWLNITGVYIPWLFEPNVNTDVTDYLIPATMMHEMSHFKGYMREDEANFIAYLTCKYSEDPVFAYSGTMMALSHSLNALYRTDQDLYWEAVSGLSPSVQADLAANRAYWKQFEGPVGEVSTAVNNVYLKSNSQASGVKSYGEMVDLLLAERRMIQN